MFDPRPLCCSSLTTAVGGTTDTNFVDSAHPTVARITDSFETKREVVLHGEDNAWTPIFRSFFKLQEVGYFPTWFTFSLKAL